MSNSNVKSLTIYGREGSETATVLAALEARNIEHYVSRDKGKLRMKVTFQDNSTRIVSHNAEVVVPRGDEVILIWLDENMETKFFPSKEANTVYIRVSKVLPHFHFYFCWYDDDIYARITRPFIIKAVPWRVSFFTTRDRVLQKFRTQSRSRIMGELKLNETEMEDKTKVRALLIEELKYFQSLFQTEDQEYLLPGKEPTAADFSLYCKLEKLVGETGDAKMSAIIPEFKEETAEDLKKLWKWYEMMVERYPIKFKGKRKPKRCGMTRK